MKAADRKPMAKQAVVTYHLSIASACRTFKISETCYRYQPKLNDENQLIAERLIGLTQNQRNWGFGLCFLYFRNVCSYPWNHKRVYRIYRELQLNMRIKPHKRLVREKPKPLAVPEQINE
ncbi:ISxcd1 transposase [Marinomonas sp. MED121]|nr:ISxcd1 transposase [Marinomonas sp. MED121]EAQ63578.1 ISxcd1 transposase [Marinomonas sp. MED121]